VLNGGQLMSIVNHSSALPGTIPLVSWGVDFTHNAVLSGSDNAYLAAQAKALAAYGKPVFIRLDWEMNGNWYPEWSSGSVSPSTYIESWRYIREYFWLEGAFNVSFVWCPNVGDPEGTPAYDWYPGDAYVDWVGLDAYPQSHLAGLGLLSGNDGLDSMAEQAASHNKPLMLAEWAPSDLSSDVALPFDQIFQWALKYPDTVKALVYFNYGSSTTDHFLVDYPVGAAEYRHFIAENREKIVGAVINPGG
jgi:beta-mannanase